MKMYKVIRKFDAAHHLQYYDGMCARLHGHTWKIEVYVSMPPDRDRDGIAIDFKELKPAIDAALPDHLLLNDTMLTRGDSPSAENLIEDLWVKIEKRLTVQFTNTHLMKLVLWESDEAAVVKEGP